MQRSHGFQQQRYADNGMWMKTQAQRQSAFREEQSWSSDNNNNNHRQQLQGMYMKPGAFAMESEHSMPKHHGKLGGSYGMFQESIPGNGHGYGSGKKFPFGGTTTNAPHHQLSNGGVRFNYGGQNDHYGSEEHEYEAYSEQHLGATPTKMDEMRYERHNWGGDHGYVNPYNYNGYKNRKPHGGHRVKWTAKRV